MKAEDKYGMFKNFMHNELGISKEDIREWIKLSITEEVEKIVNKTYENFDIEVFIRKELIKPNNYWERGEIKESILNKIASEIGKEIVKEWKIK